MTPSLARDGAHNLAVGDILGNVIIIKPTPRAYFFKFHERGLEGASRFHQILSINISPKSTLMLITRCDGNILVLKEYVEVISIMNVLEDLEVVSKAKKLPKQRNKISSKNFAQCCCIISQIKTCCQKRDHSQRRWERRSRT
jgi:hypothetical protein